MGFTVFAVLSAAGLFAGLLVTIEMGRRLGAARGGEGIPAGSGVVDGAVFGLLGLIIAFTFSGAASRFEARRHLITEEANAIGTAYLRVDLLPEDAQPELRELFRRYLDLRVAVFRDQRDIAASKAKFDEGIVVQGEIWARSVRACGREDASPQATILLLPALNEMIDITTTRLMATRNHPPTIVFLLMIGLCFVSALLVGYAMSPNRTRNWLHTSAFALVMALAIYVIVDLEFPRMGLIRVDAADEVLVELRQSMR